MPWCSEQISFFFLARLQTGSQIKKYLMDENFTQTHAIQRMKIGNHSCKVKISRSFIEFPSLYENTSCFD